MLGACVQRAYVYIMKDGLSCGPDALPWSRSPCNVAPRAGPYHWSLLYTCAFTWVSSLQTGLDLQFLKLAVVWQAEKKSNSVLYMDCCSFTLRAWFSDSTGRPWTSIICASSAVIRIDSSHHLSWKGTHLWAIHLCLQFYKFLLFRTSYSRQRNPGEMEIPANHWIKTLTLCLW